MTEEYFDGQLIQASEEPLYGRPTDLDTQYYSAKIVGNYSQHNRTIKIIWDSSKEIVEISREQIFVSKKRKRNANAANQSHSNNNDNEEEEEEVVSII